MDPERPVFYVLDTYALTSLLIVDQVCKDLEWPRPAHALSGPGLDLPRAYGANRRFEGLFIRSPEKRRYSLMLRRLIQQSAASGQATAQIVPVTVLIGRAPQNEDSVFKILFSENWGIGGRIPSPVQHDHQRSRHHGPVREAHRAGRVALDETRARRAMALGRVSRVLRVHFKRIRTSAIGPDRSHRRTLVDRRRPFRSRAAGHSRQSAARQHRSVRKAEEDARKYAYEIAADYSYSLIRIADLLLSWFWNRIYRGVQVNQFSRFRDAVEGHEVVYVPCHRSHIDYMLLSWHPLPARLRAAAHRGGHQPQSPGRRPLPSLRRCVLPAALVPGAAAVFRGLQRIRRHDRRSRRRTGVLHRRHALAHRAFAAATRRHAVDHGPRLPAQPRPADAVPTGLHRL